jgi:3-deoxy-D-manno-octulosonic-acid transferase
MKHLINIIYILISIFLVPLWIYRLLVNSSFREEVRKKIFWRTVLFKAKSNNHCIWFHGACVGELSLLEPLIELLIADNTEADFFISSYTETGYQYAEKYYPNLNKFLLPFDLSWSMRKVLSQIQPKMIVLSELELWPNLLLEAKRQNIPVVAVNSRMNDKDHAFYQRIHFLLKKPLKAMKWWGVQTETDALRIRSLIESNETTVQVTNSLKYDKSVKNLGQVINKYNRSFLGYKKNDLILVAGSTHDPEESILLKLFLKLRENHPNLYLILIPRQPARSEEIIRIANKFSIQAKLTSNLIHENNTSTPVLIVNQIGTLLEFWMLGNYAFVGGSMNTNHGGQNMLEPASMAKPTCFGTSIYNFQHTAELLTQNSGAVMVNNEKDLQHLLLDWIEHPDKATLIGNNAAEIIQSQTGATDLTYKAISEFI